MQTLIKLCGMALLPVMLGAMSCERQTEVYQPAALPPQIIKVPTFQPLPVGMTTPCPRPIFDEVPEFDYEGVGAAAKFKVWGECNERRLQAIQNAQGKPVTP